MAKKIKAITPRSENYSQCYNDIVLKADLAENAAVRGCMVIKPYGFAIWERMKELLDKSFKETGVSNAYFPLLIPSPSSAVRRSTSRASLRSALW